MDESWHIAKYLSLPRSITSPKSKIWSRSSRTGEFGGSVIPNAGSAGPRKISYITPFGYAEGADIMEKLTLDGSRVTIGMGFAIIGIAAAYWKYCKKDIR